MREKLFTIYLTEEVDQDRALQAHLGEYLDAGWEVGSITPLAAGGGGEDVLSCWFAVVLAWDDEAGGDDEEATSSR